MVRNIKYDHNVVVTGTNDGSKQVSKDAWNDGHDEVGMSGHGTVTTLTIATGAIIPINDMHKIDGEGAVADNLDNITNTETAEFDEIWLLGGAQTITMRDNSVSTGNIFTLSGTSVILSTTVPTKIIRNGTNWHEVGAGSQTPWVTDIDADGFDLNDLSNIEFRITTGAPAGTVVNIHENAGLDLIYNVNTNDFHTWTFNDVERMRLDQQSVGALVMTGMDIQLDETLSITWNTAYTQRISVPAGGGMDFDIEVNDAFDFQIATVSEYTFDATRLDLDTNDLIFRNTANTFDYTITAGAIAGARTITLPPMTGNGNFIVTGLNNQIGNTEMTGHITGKITTLSKTLLNTEIVYNDQINIFGDFAQTFHDNQFFIRNPANTFSYRFIADAITVANRDILLPLLTGNDTMVMEAFASTLTNKTITFGSNTVSGTFAEFNTAVTDATLVDLDDSQTLLNKILVSNTNRVDIGTLEAPSEAEGDVFFRNATVWTRLPRGTDNQALVATATTVGYESLTLATHVSGASTDLTDTADIAYLNQSNIFGAFDTSFQDLRLQINNPANDFQYIFDTNAIIADRNVILPLLTGDDTFVFEAFASTLTNKTINTASNTITVVAADMTDYASATATFTNKSLDANGTGNVLTNIGDAEIESHTTTKITTTAKGQLNADIVYTDETTMKASVRAATEANNALSGLTAFDGVTPVAGDRILVKAQTLGEDNGIYDASAGAWTRSTDYDNAAKVTSGTLVMVQEGTANADKGFQLTTNEPITLGTTSLTFAEFGAGGGEVFTWTADHDADGFDLNDLSNLEFRDPSTSVSGPTLNAIYVEAAGMVHNVPTGNNFAFSVNDVDEITLSPTSLDLVGTAKNITLIGSGAVGFLQMAEITDPAAGTASGKYYVKDVGGISKPFYIGEGQTAVDLSAGGGEVFTWTNDHDTGGFSLLLTDDASPPVGTQAAFYLETGDMNWNVATGNVFNFRLNDVIQVDIDDIGMSIGTRALEFGVDAVVPAVGVTYITKDTNSLNFNVATSSTFEFSLGAVPEFTIAQAIIDCQGNTLRLGFSLDQRTTSTQMIHLMEYTAAVADNTIIGELQFRAQDAGSIPRNYANIRATMLNDDAASEDGRLALVMTEAGNHNVDYIVLNEASSATIDILKPVDMNSQNITALPGTFVSALSTVTGISGDFVMISDTTDSGNLKKVDVNDFLGGGEFTGAWTADHNQTGSGFALVDARFADATDATKEMIIDLAGNTTGIALTLDINQTTAQTLTIPNINAAAQVATTGSVNDYGTFDQIFKTQRLQIDNPAVSFRYVFTAGAILGSRNILLPVLTATNTTFAFADFDNAWGDGITQVFNPDATNAGINIGQQAGEPSVLVNGDLVYDSTANQIKGVVSGAYVNLGQSGSEVTIWTADHTAADFDMLAKPTPSTDFFQLLVETTVTDDAGTEPLYHINLRRDTPAAVVTRDLFEISNNDVAEFVILNNGDVDLRNNAIRWNTTGVGHAITVNPTSLVINTSVATDTLALQTGGANRFIMNSSQITVSVPITMGSNAINFLTAGTSISEQGSDMIFDVSTGDFFSFDIAGTPELVIAGATINAATATFQEAGTDISPIGTQEISVPASGMWASSTAGALGLNKIELGTNDVDIQTFDFTSTTADEHVQFVWSPPENWDVGTVRVKFKWSHSTGTGNVRWGVQATAISNSGLIDQAWGTIQEVTDANEANNDIILSAFTPAMTVGNTPVKGDYVQWRVLRSGTDGADTFTATARLHEIIIEYSIDEATAT